MTVQLVGNRPVGLIAGDHGITYVLRAGQFMTHTGVAFNAQYFDDVVMIFEGLVTSSGDAVVRASMEAERLAVMVHATASLTGPIGMDIEGPDATVLNVGSILSLTGSAIRIGSGSVTNLGSVTVGAAVPNTSGMESGGDRAILINHGTVDGAAVGLSGTGDEARLTNTGEITSEIGIAFGGVSAQVSNSGHVIAWDVALDAMSSAGAVVTNSGTAEGGALGLRVQGSQNTIQNSGMLHGGDVGIDLGGSGHRVTNHGSIASAGDGIRVASTASEIVNHGTLSGAAHGLWIEAPGASLVNTGTISGGHGAALEASSTTLSLRNGGVLQSSSGPGAELTGQTVSFHNTGRIEAAGPGVTALGATTWLGNDGQITSAEDVAVTLGGSDGVTTRFRNGGDVSGASHAYLGGAGVDILTNPGALRGDVETGAGDDQLRNTGTITGDISVGSGNDLLWSTGVIDGAVDMGAGADRLYVHGTLLGDVTFGGLGFLGGSGLIEGTVRFGNVNSSVSFHGDITGSLFLGEGDDVVTVRGQVDGTVDLGDGNDRWRGDGSMSHLAVIRGGYGDDELYGSAGIDHLDGGRLADLLVGRGGDDMLFGGGGDDEVRGGDGDDIMIDGSGRDLLMGGRGDDFISAGTGFDTLLGGRGDDELDGQAHNDTLDGGRGNDLLTGGDGADTFVFRRNAEFDRITDFTPGRDHIDLTVFNLSYGRVEGAMVNTRQGAEIDLDALGGTGRILVEGVAPGALGAGDFFL